ncbi:OmpH family outer membrane protein [Haloferula sargassicola]
MSTGTKSHRDTWMLAAARTARGVNFGWWLQVLAGPLVIGSAAGAAALLLLRHRFPAGPAWSWPAGAGGLLLVLALVAWLVARRRFESPERSMVRIEDSMRLRNALSAAHAGVAPWPEPPAQIDAGLGWRWQRVAAPPLAALCLLLAGLFVPVGALPGANEAPSEEPIAWEKIDADLERLDQEDVVDESYLEEMRKKLEEMRAKDEEEWFSHSSLEATDSLKKRHENELQRLEREAGRADRALGNLQKNAGSLSQERKEQLLQQFDDALQGMQNGALRPNQELLQQLQQLNPNDLGQLNPDQLQQLRENLQKCGQACQDCQGGGEGEDWMDELMAGEGDQPGEGEGDRPGKGGIDRGPGEAGGVLGKEGESLKTGDLETLEAKDLSRALPGDLLQIQDGEHQVDETATTDHAGGAVGTTGSGGDRVWRESLDPDEQRALKRFFE